MTLITFKAKLLYVYNVPLYIFYFTIKGDFLVIYKHNYVLYLINVSLEILIMFIVLMECLGISFYLWLP